MIRGIFRCESSLMAICNASVSPSRGTSTGAFILRKAGQHHTNAVHVAYTHLICNALVPSTRARSYFVR